MADEPKAFRLMTCLTMAESAKANKDFNVAIHWMNAAAGWANEIARDCTENMRRLCDSRVDAVVEKAKSENGPLSEK